MTLTQIFIMILYPITAGLLLGLFYYGTLWLILQKLPQLKYPAAWISLSLLLRTMTVVFVLYVLFADSWQQLLIALSGMLISRALLVNRIKPGPSQTDKPAGLAQ
jgi:F1F0 ATPase subunit 2